MGYRSNVRMVVTGPRGFILTSFLGQLLAAHDKITRDALKEWRLMDDGDMYALGSNFIPAVVAILGQCQVGTT